uniref:Uncharacterized protein n=1 Tax=Candidatus Kentrum sp. TC TaxID=2126339 RepID=A0A450YVK9_9GAMM|nr:MAG: hypothetical protein BECKTC1821E_GA0114239_105114 [Candidatus Kentron sp. TC]
MANGKVGINRSDSVRHALAVLDDLQRDAVMNGIEDLSDEEFDALMQDDLQVALSRLRDPADPVISMEEMRSEVGL